jgi:hypothetical protein
MTPDTEPNEPRELWVFGHFEHARFAGFQEDRRHRGDKARNMVAWWPILGSMAYRGRRFGKVIVTESFRAQRKTPTDMILDEIRHTVTTPDTIWIVL